MKTTEKELEIINKLFTEKELRIIIEGLNNTLTHILDGLRVEDDVNEIKNLKNELVLLQTKNKEPKEIPEPVIKNIAKIQQIDESHGSPHDRGSADAYYGRPKDPHKYPNGSGREPRIGKEDLTPLEIEAYNYGYDNETSRADE